MGSNGELTLEEFLEAPKFVDVAVPPLRNTVRVRVLTMKERLEMAEAIRGGSVFEINCEVLRRTVDIFKELTNEELGDMTGPVGTLAQLSMKANGFLDDPAVKNE